MPFPTPNHIVVPVDFSADAFAALDLAIETANAASDITVVHVLPHLSPMEPGVAWKTVDDEKRAQHVREAFEKRLTDAKYEGLNYHVVVGDPGRSIADFAAKKGADLIVVPSHGRSGLQEILLGSVAERVVRLAHCPVLVIRK
ncbi:universal stress protein [Lignipirellula cremea]|uniref:Universal stress protein n=1 Tax=Lignipirellula cremea TaxID=2528010 RepID=A0A518DQ38_9BACT|nr:universal stress protein [Lignipirellula cremea]QDU93962.1 hypothetical protein Pla8534_17480 [Lignipirellula cremea]